MKRRGFIGALGALIPLGIWGAKQPSLEKELRSLRSKCKVGGTYTIQDSKGYKYVQVYGYSNDGNTKVPVTRGVTGWRG